ncbi:aryl-sulfate sulfotransferase [Rhodobacteraceae bacterium RKSG542]|uniref:aryl-sulfate sulfotransferase n=1 Tax=Pseudovibrio flavus TaxID=2529854 RepID=UPI0012BD1D95|nr:aryl-sulfate sulfotransferase [Pseudovibrio flavus]MTI16131.1 aryl-sulfate sulfotransferase [Pseudovibrio flavus]
MFACARSAIAPLTLSTSIVAAGLVLATPSFAASFPPAPAVGHLGHVVVDPYGNAPLSALVDLGGKHPSQMRVRVHGKGEEGVEIAYTVSEEALRRHDGVPIVGLYPNFRNTVTLEYALGDEVITEDYSILTSGLVNPYLDNRSITAVPEVHVTKVDERFEDRLYLVNTHTYTPQGTDLHWAGRKSARDKKEGSWGSSPEQGSAPFESAPLTFVVDTQGEYRWWLDPNAVFDGRSIDLDKRGYFMGFHEVQGGEYTFVNGQNWGYFDLLGRVKEYDLPRGYADASHEARPMPNGHVLVRASKQYYVNPEGDTVHTVRDFILELDQRGNLVDVWSLPDILDPYRDDLLKALNLGAVCVSTSFEAIGSTLAEDLKSASLTKKKHAIDAPYGDIPGVGAGRNWAHVNAIDYDDVDDSIILSLRHQGIVKIGRDKKVKWILSPSQGWTGELASKVLTPVDSKGDKLKCTEFGACEGGFEFSYTQHTAWLSDKGTLTVFDNGDGRYLNHPSQPTGDFSRFVEYRINEDNMTVEQVWQYGQERGMEWYSPITSNVEYRADRNTMFGFGGSIDLFERGKRTIGRINEIDYENHDVEVEIDVLSDKPNGTHYRALIVDPSTLFQQ